MNSRQILAALAACALLGAPARAQSVASVSAVVRVVKTSHGADGPLVNARIGSTLAAGDRVRTGGRSAAGIRFPDRSALRLGELTEVVVTNARQRDARVTRGQVLANYRSPGTLSGGYAVAAVRGTRILYGTDAAGKSSQVICYHGRVFVSSSD